MLRPRDPYTVLGVPVGADDATIRRAFRRLAREHHPDRSHAPDAETRFREVVQAYEQLVAPGRRPREPRADISAITSFYAWLAGRQTDLDDSDAPEQDEEPEPERRASDRGVKLAALAGLVYGVVLLALVLTR